MAKKSNGSRHVTPSEQSALDKRSIVKPDIAPPLVPATVPVATSNVRPIDDFPDLIDVLPDLARESCELADQIKALQARRKEIAEQVGPLLIAAGHESIGGPDWVAIRSVTKRETLNRIRLLEHGVSSDVIDDCTDTKEFYVTTVRRPSAPRARGAFGDENGD